MLYQVVTRHPTNSLELKGDHQIWARQATTEGNVPESAKWMDESRVGGCGHYHARSVPFHHRIGRLSSASQKQTAIVQCGSFQLVCVHFHSGARRSSLASSKLYRQLGVSIRHCQPKIKSIVDTMGRYRKSFGISDDAGRFQISGGWLRKEARD